MAVRGEIYAPNLPMPPGQDQKHMVAVVSNSNIVAVGGADPWVLVAVIRSAVHRDGRQVRLIPLFSVPIPQATIPSIVKDSICETHAIFSVRSSKLGARAGKLPQAKIDEVMAGARRHLA